MSSTARRHNTVTRRPAAPPPDRQRVSVVPWVVGGVFAVTLIATVLLTMGGTSEAAPETGSPIIAGTLLPYYVETNADAALNLPIPEVTGADFAGNEVVITNDGRAKAILFVAHWCPVCQREIPAVTEWLASNSVPDGVDLYTVATGINPDADNYPSSVWLERENWPLPVIVDSASNTAAAAFGLSAYPFWVFVNDEGHLVGRLDGYLDPETLSTILNTLAEV